MIVKESQVSAALEYLADTTVPAEARFNLTVAENRVERVKAELYLAQNGGTIEERKSQVMIRPEYQNSLNELAHAQKELERHKARARSAEMFIAVWQTENANIRAAERVR